MIKLQDVYSTIEEIRQNCLGNETANAVCDEIARQLGLRRWNPGPGKIEEVATLNYTVVKCLTCGYLSEQVLSKQKLLDEAGAAMDEAERAAGDDPHRIVPLAHRIRIMGETLRAIRAREKAEGWANPDRVIKADKYAVKDDKPFSNISVKPCTHRVYFYPSIQKLKDDAGPAFHRWECLYCGAEMEPVFKEKGK